MDISIPTFLTLGGYLIAGLLIIIGLFNFQEKQREKDADATANSLIDNLKTTTQIQKEELLSLRDKEIEQGKQIAHLEGQVKVLTDMVALRDPKTKEALDSIPKILASTENNLKAVDDLTKAMTAFITQFAAAQGTGPK